MFVPSLLVHVNVFLDYVVILSVQDISLFKHCIVSQETEDRKHKLITVSWAISQSAYLRLFELSVANSAEAQITLVYRPADSLRNND